MRKWILAAMSAALLTAGCQSGKQQNRQTQQAEQLPSQVRSIPVPESAQDQDTGGGVLFGPPAPPEPPAVSPSPASTTPTPTPEPSPEPTPAPTPAAPAKQPEPSPRAKAKAAKRASGGAGGSSVQARTGAGSLSLSELRKKYAGSFIFQGSKAQKRIALTFDDAPDTVYTPKVLDILKKHKVKATFFVVGYRAAQHPEAVKRMVREGHVVGNHSYGHSQLKKLSQAKFIQEVEKAGEVLAPLAGYTPRLVRPPYGAVNDSELAWLKDQGYLTVNWNVDPEDWRGVPKDVVLRRSLDAASPGSIILMHSATGTGGSLQGTVEALPELIEGLRSKGYELVTLPELLHTAKSK